MLGIRAGIHCVLVRIANRGKTLVRMLLQKQSDLGLHCLFLSFWLATSVQNFRTFTINVCNSQVYNSFESFLDFVFNLHKVLSENMVLTNYDWPGRHHENPRK